MPPRSAPPRVNDRPVNEAAASRITVLHQHRQIDGKHIYGLDEFDFEPSDGDLEEMEVDADWFASLPEDWGP